MENSFEHLITAVARRKSAVTLWPTSFQEQSCNSCPFKMAKSSFRNISVKTALSQPDPAENTRILEARSNFGSRVQTLQVWLKAAIGNERCIVKWRR